MRARMAATCSPTCASGCPNRGRPQAKPFEELGLGNKRALQVALGLKAQHELLD
jgi:hypothetical protein